MFLPSHFCHSIPPGMTLPPTRCDNIPFYPEVSNSGRIFKLQCGGFWRKLIRLRVSTIKFAGKSILTASASGGVSLFRSFQRINYRRRRRRRRRFKKFISMLNIRMSWTPIVGSPVPGCLTPNFLRLVRP